MAKIKHIALSTQDPEKTAAFYIETLGLQEVGKVDSPLAEGYYLTDGSIFPWIPPKGLTFNLMANADRVGTRVLHTLAEPEA